MQFAFVCSITLVEHCAVGSCCSQSTASSAKFDSLIQTISFHLMPKDTNTAKKRLSALDNPRYPKTSTSAPNHNAVLVCSKQFEFTDFTEMPGTSQNRSSRRLKRDANSCFQLIMPIDYLRIVLSYTSYASYKTAKCG